MRSSTPCGYLCGFSAGLAAAFAAVALGLARSPGLPNLDGSSGHAVGAAAPRQGGAAFMERRRALDERVPRGAHAQRLPPREVPAH